MEAVLGLFVMLLSVSHGVENSCNCKQNNGILRINNLIRNDSGEYTLGIANDQGKQTEQRTLHLSIQAPVSSVQLVSECLSQVQIRVSCYSEGGDSPQYSWTLDGHTLTDAELLCGNNEMNTITLKQDISRHLVCSVRNHVSSVSRGKTISTCDHSLLICGLKAAVAVFSIIGIFIYFAWKKKKSNKAKGCAVPQMMDDPDNSVLMVEL